MIDNFVCSEKVLIPPRTEFGTMKIGFPRARATPQRRYGLLILPPIFFLSTVLAYLGFIRDGRGTSSLLTTTNVFHERTTDASSSEQTVPVVLPSWVTDGNPETMAKAFEIGSEELSDKYDDGHRFFYAYQPYMAKMVLRKLGIKPNGERYRTNKSKPKFKMLEIGLGCHPKGGMKRGLPGGSALGWRSLFRNMTDLIELDLHVMEYDEACALKWASSHKDIAHVHTGDASSELDLARVVNETGSSHDFDLIIDDASHINWHMIKTLEVMIHQIQMGGIYVTEDIWSSCKSWRANLGTNLGEATGGSRGCMTTKTGGPTFFAKVIEWQKELLVKRVPFVDVNHIDFHGQIVVFEKGLPQTENQWKTRSS